MKRKFERKTEHVKSNLPFFIRNLIKDIPRTHCMHLIYESLITWGRRRSSLTSPFSIQFDTYLNRKVRQRHNRWTWRRRRTFTPHTDCWVMMLVVPATTYDHRRRTEKLLCRQRLSIAFYARQTYRFGSDRMLNVRTKGMLGYVLYVCMMYGLESTVHSIVKNQDYSTHNVQTTFSNGSWSSSIFIFFLVHFAEVILWLMSVIGSTYVRKSFVSLSPRPFRCGVEIK